MSCDARSVSSHVSNKFGLISQLLYPCRCVFRRRVPCLPVTAGLQGGEGTYGVHGFNMSYKRRTAEKKNHIELISGHPPPIIVSHLLISFTHSLTLQKRHSFF